MGLEPVKCGCGGEAKVDWTVINGAYMAGVVCSKCGIKTAPVWRRHDKDDAIAEAVEAWNIAMCAKDINVRSKERTAKVRDWSEDVFGHYRCDKCGFVLGSDYVYCPGCGSRLIWGDDDE